MSNVNKIPLIGELVPISVSGSVTDSKYVRGGYIVCQTIAERDDLLSTSLYPEHDVISDGTPVYVAANQKTYRYRAELGNFVEDSYYNTSITDLQMQNVYGNISCVSQDVSNLSTDVSGLISTTENLSTDLSALSNTVDNISDHLGNLSELRVSGNTSLNNLNASGETNLNGFTSSGDSEVYGNFAVCRDGAVGGNVTIEGDLDVMGTTTTHDQQSLTVKDNFIYTNADKATLISLSGLGINVDADNTYGIAYDPGNQSVKIGLGTVDENGAFTFNNNEGSPITARDDSSLLSDGHLMKWDASHYRIVDSGISYDDVQSKITQSSMLSSDLVDDTNSSHKFITSSERASWNNKADKVSGATNGNLAGLDSNGNLIDSNKKPSDFTTAAQGQQLQDTKMDKVTSAVENNLPKFSSSGDVVDSGIQLTVSDVTLDI